MKKIKRLPKEAKDKFQEYIDKWVQIGTSTDACDIIEAMDAVNEPYLLSSLKSKPKYMVGPVNNPIEGGIAEKILQEFAQNNKYTKPLMKQLDNIWKKIETYLQKEMKKQLG